MLRSLGLGAIVVGAILLFYGFKQQDSLVSEVKEAITGTPTDRTLMFQVGGGGLVVVGLGLLVFGRK